MILINEDDKLLQSTINYRLTYKDDGSIVEFIIRPDCNQKCDYCYLTQYGLESYPLHERATRETIINNVKLLTDYFYNNNYFIKELNLFAGDLFFDNLFFEIIEPIYEYYNKWYKKEPEKFEVQNMGKLNWPTIVMPTNFTFCYSPEKIEKIEQVYKRFKDIHVFLFLSYSSDGLYSTDTREHKKVEENFFDTCLSLCSKYDWGVHPMLGYENIDNAIQSYEWWKQKFRQFNIGGNAHPYYLEVRNDGWTDETIKKYLEFLNYFIDDLYNNMCEKDIKKFFDMFWNQLEYVEKTKSYQRKANGYSIHLFYPSLDFTEHSMGCGLGSFDICINAANLQIVGCHRLAYPMLSGGHFEVNEEKTEIINLAANENIGGYLNLIGINTLTEPGCITCKWNQICMHGCCGAQFEKFGDPGIPIPSVCNLLNQKYTFLFKKYHEMGVFDYYFKNCPDTPDKDMYLKYLIDMGYKEYEQYK